MPLFNFNDPGKLPDTPAKVTSDSGGDDTFNEVQALLDKYVPSHPDDRSEALAELRKAQQPQGTKGLLIGTALAGLIPALFGGKAGRAGAGEAMQNFGTGFNTAADQRRRDAIELWYEKWAGRDQAEKDRNSMLRAILPEYIKAKMPVKPTLRYNVNVGPEKLPHQAQLWNFRKTLAPDDQKAFDVFVKRQVASGRPLSTDQLMAGWLQDAVNKGTMTREDAMKKLSQNRQGVTGALMRGQNIPMPTPFDEDQGESGDDWEQYNK